MQANVCTNTCLAYHVEKPSQQCFGLSEQQGTKLMMKLSENRLPLSSFSHENCHLEGIFIIFRHSFSHVFPRQAPLRFHTFAPPCQALCSRSADGQSWDPLGGPLSSCCRVTSQHFLKFFAVLGVY